MLRVVSEEATQLKKFSFFMKYDTRNRINQSSSTLLKQKAPVFTVALHAWKDRTDWQIPSKESEHALKGDYLITATKNSHKYSDIKGTKMNRLFGALQ